MHKLASAFTAFDKEPHPQEEVIQCLVDESMSEAAPLIKQARAIGIPWATILALVLQYGPNFAALLQAILVALNQEPPKPMAEKFVANPEAVVDEDPHGRRRKHHKEE